MRSRLSCPWVKDMNPTTASLTGGGEAAASRACLVRVGISVSSAIRAFRKYS